MRSPRRYAVVRRPWQAVLDVTAPEPARQYVTIVSQALRYGMPATRRLGRAWSLAGRRGLPVAPSALALRRLPGRPRPELDELLAAVQAQWPRLSERSPRLPERMPELSLLVLERAAARTIFVLGDEPAPLLVLKIARPGHPGLEREREALREAEPAGVAPLDLGDIGDAHVQEGLRGAPLRVEPLRARDAGGLRWSPPLQGVADGLTRLAAATAKPGDQAGVRDFVERALDAPQVDAGARRALAAAWRDVERLDRCVLRHVDTSPQNCLMAGDRLSGLIDWEMAQTRGIPAFDVANAALAYLHGCVGLVEWSQELGREAFDRAWAGEYWARARAAASAAAAAAGVPDALHEALLVTFFGSTVGVRVAMPERFLTTVDTTAHMLRTVTG